MYLSKKKNPSFPTCVLRGYGGSLEGSSSFLWHVKTVIKEKNNADVFDTADPTDKYIYLQTLLLQVS